MLLQLGIKSVVAMYILYFYWFRITLRHDRTILKMESYLEHIYVSENGATYVKDPGPTVFMSDARLVKNIAGIYLFKPAQKYDPYNWDNPNGIDPSAWQARRVMYLLTDKVSSENQADRNLPGTGMNSRFPAGSNLPGHRQEQCLSFNSYLLSLNRTPVYFPSLNVQGTELDTLRTILFEKLDIKTISVEYSRVLEGKLALKLFMEEQGYSGHDPIFGKGMKYNYIFFKNEPE